MPVSSATRPVLPVLSSSAAAASAPVFPPASAYATELVAPAINTWALRQLVGGDIVFQRNDSAGVIFSDNSQRWTAASTEARLRQQLGDDAYSQQQQRLAQWLQTLQQRLSDSTHSNYSVPAVRSHHDKHDGQHGHHGSAYADLSSFYLRHAQCRACVQSNLPLLANAASAQPDYQPVAIMKWCSNVQPKLSCEQSPSADSPFPLQDWEGYCVPASASCPTSTVDLNILSPTTCNADEPATKQSCPLCVADGFTWQTSRRAIKTGDNYDGSCVDQSAAPSDVVVQDGDWHRVVSTLDSCPSVAYSDRQARHFYKMTGGFSLFFTFAAACCCAMMLRRCCIARRNARLARLSAAAAPATVHISVAEPAVAQVRAQPRPSAPAADMYPSFAAQRPSSISPLQQPLISSGLNPPFYPQLANSYYARV